MTDDPHPGAARKKLGLALGGGGARGMAHVGILQVLAREGIPIDCIAGTSAGSLVGAAYAAGLGVDRLLELALDIRWRDLGRLVWPGDGLVSFDRMEAFLVGQLGDLSFADLQIAYAAVAADLDTGRQVILRRGRLAPAVQASCSVPGLVTPVELDGRLLTDGGVVNNLPISVVREMGADVVLAVGLGDPTTGRPHGARAILLWAMERLLYRAGDDPATADIFLPVPFEGFASMVRTSLRHRFIARGRHLAEEALPQIRAALQP
ncbi:MAG: patatin-like phospholipase family protein [Anaerolineae bacterium]